jgi:hypothetical protein
LRSDYAGHLGLQNHDCVDLVGANVFEIYGDSDPQRRPQIVRATDEHADL